MFGSLTRVVLLAALTAGHCQFLRRGDGASFVSSFSSSSSWGQGSSFSSSSSWAQGSDGQMHKQVQESRTEIVRDENGMKKQKQTKTVCRDGDCTKVVEEFAPGPMQERQRMPFLHRMPMPATPHHGSMQALMQQLLSRMQKDPDMAVPSVKVVVLPEPQSQPRWSPAWNFFEGQRVFPAMSSASAGAPPAESVSGGINLGWDRVEPISGVRVVPPASPSQQESFRAWANAWLTGENLTVGEKNARNTLLTRVAAISCGSLMALMIVMFVAKFFRYSGIHASAREGPLQALAEPLAADESPVLDVQKEAVKSGAVPSVEYEELRVATQMYLSRVYVRFFD